MIKSFLLSKGIELFALVRLSDCKITKKYLLERARLSDNASVLVMLLPYRSENKPKNLSVYASVRDYHAYTDMLRAELKELINNHYNGATCELFADHSPLDEVNLACIAGLGFIGDNGLLITEKYSSFVFICELIIDLDASALGLEYTKDVSIKRCFGCKACMRACPSNCMDESDPRPKSECLSAITQKKGELTEAEKQLILENGSLWGCDICQNVCPYTKNAKYTPIEFFKKEVITELSAELISNMSDEEFLSRPFSWRGKEIVLRNLKCFEK